MCGRVAVGRRQPHHMKTEAYMRFTGVQWQMKITMQASRDVRGAVAGRIGAQRSGVGRGGPGERAGETTFHEGFSLASREAGATERYRKKNHPSHHRYPYGHRGRSRMKRHRAMRVSQPPPRIRSEPPRTGGILGPGICRWGVVARRPWRLFDADVAAGNHRPRALRCRRPPRRSHAHNCDRKSRWLQIFERLVSLVAARSWEW